MCIFISPSGGVAAHKRKWNGSLHLCCIRWCFCFAEQRSRLCSESVPKRNLLFTRPLLCIFDTVGTKVSGDKRQKSEMHLLHLRCKGAKVKKKSYELRFYIVDEVHLHTFHYFCTYCTCASLHRRLCIKDAEKWSGEEEVSLRDWCAAQPASLLCKERASP